MSYSPREDYSPFQTYYLPAGADMSLLVEYDFTPIIEGKHTLSNGDPGYPDEGGELYLITVYDEENSKDITNSIPGDLEEKICTHITKLKHHKRS